MHKKLAHPYEIQNTFGNKQEYNIEYINKIYIY